MSGAEVQIRGAKTGVTITSPITTFNTLQTIDYHTLASIGLISGHSQGSRVGTNENIPSANFILLSNVTSAASPINFPSVAQQMQVVSSSASDTAAGTGAQQVEITYLTSPTNPTEPFKNKTEILTMNGTTPVLTTNTNIFRIDRFRVSRVGTSLFALGNISLQSVGGATTFDRIDALTNVNRTAIHFIQKGYGCILTDVIVGASTAAGVIFIVEETELDPSNNAVTLGQTQLELGNQGISTGFISPHAILNTAGKIMFFAIVVKGRASNQAASGSMHFIDFTL